MTKKDFNNWFMYHEIHKLSRLGFSIAKIANYIAINPRTVSKYLKMNEIEYERFLIHACKRTKTLETYETFVAEKLTDYPDTSAAQVHDWLKEHHPDFPLVTPRTVFNFVMFVRQKHNIPFEPQYREYFPVEELPYGEQSQVDFGEYNMQLSNGKRKKVRFFAMVLSRSRMKYTWFLDKPFTSETVVQAHEKAFEFFDGIPKTIVYDQDRTMIVDENIGDIILTATFKQYTKSRSFKLHFCRKSDPESKGKIENVIQYVKKNFLYNRTFFDIEELNIQAIAWLGRTANYLVHNYTKIAPESEYRIEKPYLTPFSPLTIEYEASKLHHVRKTNVIAYKSNFYTLPEGTYRGTGTQVVVMEKEDTIRVYTLGQELLSTHILSKLKGKTITNTDHRRDKSHSVEQMLKETISYFTDESMAIGYLDEVKNAYPRYFRDHLQVMLKVLKNGHRLTVDKTLEFCKKNGVLNGNEWYEVYYVFLSEFEPAKPFCEVKLLDKNNLQKAGEVPQVSNIDEYERIINL
jgi:IS30 family transposase